MFFLDWYVLYFTTTITCFFRSSSMWQETSSSTNTHIHAHSFDELVLPHRGVVCPPFSIPRLKLSTIYRCADSSSLLSLDLVSARASVCPCAARPSSSLLTRLQHSSKQATSVDYCCLQATTNSFLSRKVEGRYQ